MAVDWLAIRNDYINGGGSYRKLAEKYGVPFGSLRSRAEKENWPELKKEQLHKISIKTADIIPMMRWAQSADPQCERSADSAFPPSRGQIGKRFTSPLSTI